MSTSFSHLKNLPPDPSVGGRQGQFDDPVEQITSDLGGYFRNGTGHINCPVCGDGRQVTRGNKHNATIKHAEKGGMVFHCFASGCAFKSFLSATQSRGIKTGQAENAAPMTEAEIAARDAQEAKRQARTTANVHAALAGTTAITPSDPAGLYLANRGIHPDAIAEANRAGDLMYRPNLPWGYCDATKQNLFLPAMVARIRTPQGEAVQRLYLTPEGEKAPSLPNRKMLGRAKDGTVTLANRPGGKILVCEGIETGLSLASGLVSDFGTIYATLSTSILQAGALPIPASDTREIQIFADGDQAGRDAANKAAANLARTRPQNPVKIYSAPNGLDFNDVLIAELRKRGLMQ